MLWYHTILNCRHGCSGIQRLNFQLEPSHPSHPPGLSWQWRWKGQIEVSLKGFRIHCSVNVPSPRNDNQSQKSGKMHALLAYKQLLRTKIIYGVLQGTVYDAASFRTRVSGIIKRKLKNRAREKSKRKEAKSPRSFNMFTEYGNGSPTLVQGSGFLKVGAVPVSPQSFFYTHLLYP